MLSSKCGYNAFVYRRIGGISSYNLDLHRLDEMSIEDVSPEKISEECYEFSRESNGSELRPDKNLFFMIMRGETPVAYGSPGSTQILWRETHFIN